MTGGVPRKPVGLYLTDLPAWVYEQGTSGYAWAPPAAPWARALRTRLFDSADEAAVWVVSRQISDGSVYHGVIFERTDTRRPAKGTIIRRINNGKGWWEK